MLPTANALASEIPGLPGSRRWNPCLYLDHGVPLPWFPVTSDPQRSSFWRGRCPLPGDQRQDVREPLGHLKRDVAAMADDLGTDLDQLLAAGWSVTADDPGRPVALHQQRIRQAATAHILEKLTTARGVLLGPRRQVQERLAAVRRLNGEPSMMDEPPLEIVVALHVGTVVYRNIGAAGRLDFTVIGPAVNLVSRLETTAKTLNTPIVLSDDFARACGRPLVSLGQYPLRGLARPH